jgi:hypothetical protein
LSANAFGIAAARRNGRFDHADHVARRHGACGVFRGHAAGAFAIALRIVRARLPRRRA